VYQEPRGSCLMKKTRGRISWHGPFKFVFSLNFKYTFCSGMFFAWHYILAMILPAAYCKDQCVEYSSGQLIYSYFNISRPVGINIHIVLLLLYSAELQTTVCGIGQITLKEMKSQAALRNMLSHKELALKHKLKNFIWKLPIRY
jgi:hypothetical protein